MNRSDIAFAYAATACPSPRIQGAIGLLADDPRPPSSRPLRGRPGYRVRVGDYRIIYTVADDVLLIVVVALGHRREVFDR